MCLTSRHYKLPVCSLSRRKLQVSRAMSAQPNFTHRFVRKTQLATSEYHKNFHKIDREIIAAVTSPEADKVTPLMSKIYLRLVNAPDGYWEREGVLRFEAQSREGKHIKAWNVLCEVTGVASATANKALTWLHDQGIIGYFSGKNGVGLRIFLNRAISSIGVRVPAADQKILRLASDSSAAARVSQNEAAFNDSFAVLENLDSDLNRHAPKNGADTKVVDKTSSEPDPPPDIQSRASDRREGSEVEEGKAVETATHRSNAFSVDEIVARLRSELEPCVKAAAVEAAAQTAAREIARTREWFETKALPKAVRVAQHETYDLLKKHGQLDERSRRARAELEVGRSTGKHTTPLARPLTPEEIQETAETCVALLEAQGKSIDETLSENSSEGGGWLLPEDAPRVREIAQKLLSRSEGR